MSLAKQAHLVHCLLIITLLYGNFVVEAKHKFDFKGCGGAQSCLGPQQLEQVAQRSGLSRHGRTQTELAKTLDEDDDLGVDVDNSMLVYACAGLAAAVPTADGKHRHQHRSMKALDPTAQDAEIVSGWMPSMPDAPISKADAFRLHSRPNATLKIMLDFDGHNTTGTAWNTVQLMATITSKAYDKDGDPKNWSADELSYILAIWRGVAEDYAPWNVDVTTEDPGDAYLLTKGIRAVIGGDYRDWYGTAAGGVAYVGVFGKYNGYYSPAFIFPLALGPNYAKYVWEAVSHEVGHTLGLSHDGQTGGTAYYQGIMGVGYYKPVTQWSKGEYINANIKEDDIAIISSYLGSVTAIAQEHGSTLTNATVLVGAPSQDNTTARANASGIIRQPSDVEVFTWTSTTTGPLAVQLLGAPDWRYTSAANQASLYPRSNLNATVTVMDAQGTTLRTVTGVGVGPFVLPTVAAGKYYASVKPSGGGDPVRAAYSSYGSIGQYELLVTYATAAPISNDTGSQVTGPSPYPSPYPELGLSPSPMVFTSPSPSPSPPTSPSPSASPSPSPSPKPSPSPSPIPIPSPSPSPKPSPTPSPSPNTSPSPKPSPSPSPSPPPSTNVMNISSIIVTNTTANSRVTCKATVTVVLSYNGAKVSSASVAGTWNSVLTATGWPSTAFSSRTGGTGTSLGVVTFTSSRTLPIAAGNGCSFTVTSLSKTGLVKDPSAVLGPVLLTW